MKQILIILTIILSINLVFAMNGTLNLSETNLTWSNTSLNFNTIGSSMFSIINISGLGTLRAKDFITMSPTNCINITGDFIVKRIYIGTEKNESNISILDELVTITSYEGDFYKHPEFNITEGHLSGGRHTYETLDFFEDKNCEKNYIGMRVEQRITKRRWWFDKVETIYNPMMIYVCEEKLNSVRYCD